MNVSSQSTGSDSIPLSGVLDTEGATVTDIKMSSATQRVPMALVHSMLSYLPRDRDNFDHSVRIFDSLAESRLQRQEVRKTFAQWVSNGRIPLRKLNIEQGQLQLLLPHLSYVDFRGFDFSGWDSYGIERLLSMCDRDKMIALRIDAPQLEHLPRNLAKLELLDCCGCKALRGLPANLTSVQELYLRECRSVTQLPAGMTQLRRLDTWCCVKLQAIPDDANALTHLECGCCPQLIHLPRTLTDIIELNCSYCARLSNIPSNMHRLQRFRGMNSPLLPFVKV
jgi:hypothetical protein